MSVDGERELPAGWAWVKLDQVCDVTGGIQKQAKRRPVKNKFPFLRVANVGRGRLDLGDVHEVELFEGELDRFRLKDGDLLVVEGNGSPDQVGRAATWHGAIKDAVHQNHLIKVRPTSVIDPKFLELLWNSPDIASQLLRVAQSTSGLYTLSTSKLNRVEFALPPLAEQRRIVDALEEQLSRLDVAIISLGSSAVRGANLRKALVARAFSGALLPDDGGARTARPLLERVDSQVSAQAGKKRWSQERAPAQEWRQGLPEGWEWRTLGSLSVLIQYGTSAKAEAAAVDGAVPVIRMGNIQSGSIVMDSIKYLPGDHPDIDPMRLQDGDLLFNRTNSAELVGKSAVYRDVLGEAAFASYLIRCRLADGIDPDWVNAYVNSPGGRKYIRSVLSQQVGQANVNSAKLAMFPIPVPPAEEQARIMENLREWYRLLEHSDKGRESAKLRATGLRESLLRAAFAGTLTQQSPDDAPAADLLDRIAAERAAEAKPKRTRSGTHRRTVEASAAAPGPAPEPTPAPALAVQQEFDL
ncbi:restriction endonuclease subunit S [Streptomyces sp. NBC_01549]|uniref:restriction endonuclease subunit S n=1 Tax=Streptomyces sp. NBC_01549 TaxID=2975874 RepID=UPI002B1CB9A0|nr:restriction endonuclease subunit S [Streptomyces sp. NBC_01549]